MFYCSKHYPLRQSPWLVLYLSKNMIRSASYKDVLFFIAQLNNYVMIPNKTLIHFSRRNYALIKVHFLFNNESVFSSTITISGLRMHMLTIHLHYEFFWKQIQTLLEFVQHCNHSSTPFEIKTQGHA